MKRNANGYPTFTSKLPVSANKIITAPTYAISNLSNLKCIRIIMFGTYTVDLETFSANIKRISTRKIRTHYSGSKWERNYTAFM